MTNKYRPDLYGTPKPLEEIHPFEMLKALGQPTRIELFRMIHSSDNGEWAHVLMSRFSGPSCNISLHLAVLARTGLITGRRIGRETIYHSNPASMQALHAYMCGEHNSFDPTPRSRKLLSQHSQLSHSRHFDNS